MPYPHREVAKERDQFAKRSRVRGSLQAVLVVSMMIAVFTHLVDGVDLDALAIVGLSVLVCWVIRQRSRRDAALDRKLDHMLSLHRSGLTSPRPARTGMLRRRGLRGARRV